jgi:hypothetical protein
MSSLRFDFPSGIPVALLLMQRNATVTIAHSRTADIEGEREFLRSRPSVNRDWWLICHRTLLWLSCFFGMILTLAYSILHPHLATPELSRYFILCKSVISNCPSRWHHCRCCGQSRDGQEGNFLLFFSSVLYNYWWYVITMYPSLVQQSPYLLILPLFDWDLSAVSSMSWIPVHLWLNYYAFSFIIGMDQTRSSGDRCWYQLSRWLLRQERW